MPNDLLEIPHYTEKSIQLLKSVVIVTHDDYTIYYGINRGKVFQRQQEDYVRLRMVRMRDVFGLMEFYFQFYRQAFNPNRVWLTTLEWQKHQFKVRDFREYRQLLPFLFNLKEKLKCYDIYNSLPISIRQRFFKPKTTVVTLPFRYRILELKEMFKDKEFLGYKSSRANRQGKCMFVLSYYNVNDALISYLEQKAMKQEWVDFLKGLFNDTSDNRLTMEEYCEKKARYLLETTSSDYLDSLRAKIEEQRKKRIGDEKRENVN